MPSSQQIGIRELLCQQTDISANWHAKDMIRIHILLRMWHVLHYIDRQWVLLDVPSLNFLWFCIILASTNACNINQIYCAIPYEPSLLVLQSCIHILLYWNSKTKNYWEAVFHCFSITFISISIYLSVIFFYILSFIPFNIRHYALIFLLFASLFPFLSLK